ncbi:MAG TPA: hypothetical protein VF115_01975 [Acidimicrobiia bacterium]
MEPERDEVYERIPWETLEPKGGNRQWLVYAVAGALVLGALAYSFTRNQPVAPAPQAAQPPVTSTVPATTATTAAAPTPSTVASPVVVAEADLYAVDPERLIDQATAHAEWFAVEYVSYDGSEESANRLQDLLPKGMPLPHAPEGTQVFVDWARATGVDQTGPITFEVAVLVRSLNAANGSTFVRQPPQRLLVSVDFDAEGGPRVTRPPELEPADAVDSADLTLQTVPAEVMDTLDMEGEVVGGLQEPDGSWLIVVMTPGVDGVTRPMTVSHRATP